MMATLHDTRVCDLGEGAFWHPGRQEFFWFDILNRRLLSQCCGGPEEWRFDRIATAAGQVGPDEFLIATETGLALLDLQDGALRDLIPVEANRPDTRSNDGRADRQGGFWFGTMGKAAEAGAGSIYRFYRGHVERLFPRITIPNAICFAPDGRTAYFADTAEGMIWAQTLDADGWPEGERRVLADFREEGLNPDGAVVDETGALWVALWGQGAVLRLGPDGTRLERHAVGGAHSSCPAFGGPDLGHLLVTTATEGMDDPGPGQGQTWLLTPGVRGLAEPSVIL
ncbi:SMP-30/gluconolactonase/LRE family protein [Neotabrizicola sp. VNH66]|uniref:SMP-30/gluconolactonase/LRE family protein n=1 Tax=Neotabrizicola sp. VNH66 TaxID=3400918 RepID=UPI003BFD3DFC